MSITDGSRGAVNLTFRGPCIVIYSYYKSQQDALFLNFILIKNSACFGQTYCPSSGVLILVLYSQQIKSAPTSLQTVNKIVINTNNCCEYSIKTPDDRQ